MRLALIGVPPFLLLIPLIWRAGLAWLSWDNRCPGYMYSRDLSCYWSGGLGSGR